MRRYDTLNPGELRPGMVAYETGMRVLIDEQPRHVNDSPHGRVFQASGVVVNRDEISPAAVPLSFTGQEYRDGRWQAVADGKHRWTFQGNDLARVGVQLSGCEPQA